jgi:hypothetical protein
MYNQLHEINMVARHVQLYYPKRLRDAAENTELMDPDMFPMNRLSSDLVVEYESVWETERGKKMLKEIERYLGHTLRIKDSSIDHHLAGKGVFLSCRRQGIVLPGTLLGIFPGVINSPGTPMPPTPKRGVKPYVQRPDGFWIDYETELPYPLLPQGTNFTDHIEHFHYMDESRGLGNQKMVRASAEAINPFAVGHFINHPPPDVAANVKLVDFDLPYTFFPSYMGKYIPYMNSNEVSMEDSSKKSTRNNEVMRACALVAQQTIAHDEELFYDYIEEKRTEIDYTPDWLIQPPHPNPYLEKKEMISNLPFAVKLLIFYDQTRKGRTFEEFEGRSRMELPEY